jgi:hypothetical protein
MSLRASVGSTEAAKNVVARFGVVGPKRAAREDPDLAAPRQRPAWEAKRERIWAVVKGYQLGLWI